MIPHAYHSPENEYVVCALLVPRPPPDTHVRVQHVIELDACERAVIG